jgi:hypothetical protein
MMTDTDARLAALLGKAGQDVDERFVDSVMAEVEADEWLRANRAASWRQFAGEAAATVAVVASAVLLTNLAGDKGVAGVLLLALFGSWVLIVRPLAQAHS